MIFSSSAIRPLNSISRLLKCSFMLDISSRVEINSSSMPSVASMNASASANFDLSEEISRDDAFLIACIACETCSEASAEAESIASISCKSWCTRTFASSTFSSNSSFSIRKASSFALLSFCNLSISTRACCDISSEVPLSLFAASYFAATDFNLPSSSATRSIFDARSLFNVSISNVISISWSARRSISFWIWRFPSFWAFFKALSSDCTFSRSLFKRDFASSSARLMDSRSLLAFACERVILFNWMVSSSHFALLSVSCSLSSCSKSSLVSVSSRISLRNASIS